MRKPIWLVLLIVTQPVLAANSGWRVDVEPYAWLAGLEGDVTVANNEASFDYSFSDIVNDVNMGAMGLGVVRWNRFFLYGQLDYVDLQSDADITGQGPGGLPLGASVDGDMTTRIATFGAGYQLDIFGKHQLDLALGVRDFDVEVDLKLDGNKTTEDSDVTDAIVLVSPTFWLSDRWLLKPVVSFGIGGDSDSTWELQPQIHYRVTPRFGLALGYRKLHYKLDSGQKNTPSYREFDGDLYGLMLGVSWNVYGGTR